MEVQFTVNKNTEVFYVVSTQYVVVGKCVIVGQFVGVLVKKIGNLHFISVMSHEINTTPCPAECHYQTVKAVSHLDIYLMT